jgi:hypothetical protein
VTTPRSPTPLFGSARTDKTTSADFPCCYRPHEKISILDPKNSRLSVGKRLPGRRDAKGTRSEQTLNDLPTAMQRRSRVQPRKNTRTVTTILMADFTAFPIRTDCFQRNPTSSSTAPSHGYGHWPYLNVHHGEYHEREGLAAEHPCRSPAQFTFPVVIRADCAPSIRHVCLFVQNPRYDHDLRRCLPTPAA